MWSAGVAVEIGRKPGGRHRLRLGGPGLRYAALSG